MCSDDARTRAEGISEGSIRRDSVYALVLVSHCVTPFVFDVKLARDDIVVSSIMALMTDQVPNVRVKAAIMSSWFRCEYRRHCLHLDSFATSNPRGFM